MILLGVRDDRSHRQSAPAPAARGRGGSGAGVLDGTPLVRSGLSAGADSPSAWLETLRDARDRRWLKSAAACGGSDVQDLIAATVESVRPPRHDRGGEFIEGNFSVGYRPDWFVDGRLEGLCNHSTREHMPRISTDICTPPVSHAAAATLQSCAISPLICCPITATFTSL